MQTRFHATLDPILTDVTQRGALPGVVALLTDAQDTCYVHASGIRSLETGAAMTADTVCWIASMTKMITSIAALQLVEQGKLSLDEPASRWFSDLGKVQVLEGFDANDQPRLRAPARPVTLRHLLTHTAGYAYEFFNADIMKFQAVTGTPAASSCRNALFQHPLIFDPGERWHYGINIDVVGKIVEGASGQRLGEYLHQHVLGPLGMHDTAFKLTESMHARRAAVHARGEGGALTATSMLVEQNPEFEMGGGGLYSTALDYARLLRLILNRGVHQGQRLLSEQTVALMLRNAIGDLRVTPLPPVVPQLAHTFELYPEIEKTWSLVGMLNESPLASGRAAGSLMWAGLANTYFWVDPQHNLAGLLMAQVLPFADPTTLQTLEAFETQAYRVLASVS